MEVRKGYKQTEVGIIPTDWKVNKLGEVAYVTKLAGFEYTNYFNSYKDGGDIIVVRGTNITNNRLDLSEVKTIPRPTSNKLPRSKLHKDDLVFAYVGTIGPVYLIEEDDRFHLGPNTCKISVGDSMNPHFLFHYFTSWLIHNEIIEYTSVGAQPSLSMSKIRIFTIVLPPTKVEQTAIAAALSDADALISNLEKLISKKRNIKKGVMQQLVTGKKRLPGFTGEWRTFQLGELITNCSSGATPYRGCPDYYTGTVKWITSSELNFNLIMDTIEHISEDAVEKTNLKVHPVGTFLMAITGLEAAGTRGACGIVGSPATTNQSCMAIYPTSELKIEYLYHYYVLRGNDLALRYCQGTKQQSYTAKLVKLLPIDLPPTIDEQIAIAKVFSDMDTEIEALDRKLSKYRLIKQGMMQELLAGKKRLI